MVVKATVAHVNWINMTDADAEWWAEHFIGKPMMVDNKSAGYIVRTWVGEDGSVEGEIEIDNAALESALESRWDGAIA